MQTNANNIDAVIAVEYIFEIKIGSSRWRAISRVAVTPKPNWMIAPEYRPSESAKFTSPKFSIPIVLTKYGKVISGIKN
ncbi:hypothetical protein D3C80_1810540 [compost metagenome]